MSHMQEAAGSKPINRNRVHLYGFFVWVDDVSLYFRI